MRKHFFTLLELLLTIAIMAILTSLFLPAFQKARKQGRLIACASVMRQIDLVVSNYETDYNDICIPSATPSLWSALLARGGYWNGYYDVNKLYPKNVICPAETRQRIESGVVYSTPHISYTSTWDYGLNNISTGPHPAISTGIIVKKSKLSRPSMLMNLMDLNAAETDYNYSSFLIKASSRHGAFGEGNIVFMDGHLNKMKRIPFQSYSGESISTPSKIQYPYWFR